MKTTVSSKGQIVLPAELRERDRIQSGQEFEIERVRRGEYRLTRIRRNSTGTLAWLKSCPVKGYFVAVPSESTDTL